MGDKDEAVRPPKAYKSMAFMNSREARTIRVICEFEETLRRLRAQNVKETIMFFGSARAKDHAQHAAALKAAKAKAEAAKSDEEKRAALDAVERLEAGKWMCDIVETTTELARKLTEWAMSYKSTAVVGGGFLATGNEDDDKAEKHDDGDGDDDDDGRPNKRARTSKQSLMICTGGGPGLMEAANKGAYQVEGGKSIGMGITLPFEAGLNPYVTPELGFEYHYFFTRKYWMLFPCRALIVAPGGFGTMDELFELLNLKRTEKIKADVPIVLLGKDYWQTVLNLRAGVKHGTISQQSVDALLYTDSVDEAFDFVTSRIIALRDGQ